MSKVSVIIPVYNVEKYLDQCVQSVMKQKHKDLEIILVNDGSSDNSGKIADNYTKKDKRIKVIHQENAGVSAARNAGIDVATGEYICFIDSDDYVEEDYVSYMLGLSSDGDADVSLTTEMFTILRPTQIDDVVTSYTPEEATLQILYSNIPIGCYCKLYRRNFINKHKLRFLPAYQMGEGFNFNTSAFQRASTIIVGRRKIYNYRLDNVDSVTTKFNMSKWLNGLDALKNIRKNLVIKTPSVKNAWKFAWWLTNYDIVRLMIGVSEQDLYRSEYNKAIKIVKRDSPKLSSIPGSKSRKAHMLLIKMSPVIAARIFNYRRARAMRNIEKVDGAIVCITTNNNYGNVIQRFALQRFLWKNGYNFVSYYFYGFYLRQYVVRQTLLFAPLRILAYTLAGRRRDLKKSSSIYNYHRLSKFANRRIKQELFIPNFTKKYKSYIVGSDQVFNYRVISEEFLVSWKNFFLSFVTWDAKRIAYAPSFGNEKLNPKDAPIVSAENKRRVQKFDAVSSRERSGVKIMKENWGIDSKEVLDPALLLTQQDYADLVEHSLYELEEVDPVFYYILRDDAEGTLLGIVESSANQLGKEFSGISTHAKRNLPGVEQWLKGFCDSEMVITDSFHGAIFSIINHRSFVVLCFAKFKSGGGSVRYRNLLNKLGISGRVIDEDDFENFDANALEPIDWKIVDEKLAKLRKESAGWLLEQLKDNIK